MKVVSLKQHLEVDAPDGFRRFRTIVSPAIGRTRLNSSGTFYESRAIRAGGSPNRPSAQLDQPFGSEKLGWLCTEPDAKKTRSS